MWKMIVKQVDTGRVWEETITVLGKNFKSKPLPKRTPIEKAEEQAREIITYFNNTLRVGESPRELIGVRFYDEE